MGPTLPDPAPAHLRRIRWHVSIADLARWRYEITGQRCRTFCEAGVGPPDVAAAPDMYRAREEEWGPYDLLLVEPNPELADAALAAMPGANIRRVAIAEGEGTARMELRGGSSRLEGRWSPGGGEPGGVASVATSSFADLDPGDIDILVLDCEGAEWAALSRMVSRPWLLSVEIWDSNPYAREIEGWLAAEGYRAIMTTGPTGETWVCVRH
jgi:hypothetical protein